MNFKSMGLSPKLVESIEALGFESPTKVQELAIPEVLAMKDLIVMAKTGSGKTGAFSIPMIEKITEEKMAQALILTPTRELAVQVEKDIQAFTKHVPVKSMAVYGQHNMQLEEKQLNEGRQIIVGTPGRTLHHIEERNLKTKDIKFLILDEADRMLDMGFIDQMIKIIKKLPKDRVTLLFSATMPPEIQRMCQSYMRSPETIAIDSDTKTVDAIKQGYYRVAHNEKRTQLERILAYKQPMSCMVFCNTRIEVDKVSNYLYRKGYLAEAIHGANTQARRMRTITAFKNGDIQIMVATDVAARGLHVEDLALVINYDVPIEKDSYIHRIGRTGRAGNGGEAVSLITSDDVYTFYEIEEHVGTLIDELDLPTTEEIKESLANKSDHWDKKWQEKQKHEGSKTRNKAHGKPNQGRQKPGQRPVKGPKKYEKPHHNKVHEKAINKKVVKAADQQVTKPAVKPATKPPVKPVEKTRKPAVETIQVAKKKKFSLFGFLKKKKTVEIKRFYD